MSKIYPLQNFKDKDILYAEQLNKIENEILEMSKEPNVFVQQDEPKEAMEGDIWIIPTTTDKDGIPIEIPTYNEEDYGKVLMATEKGLMWVYASEYDELKDAERVSF